MMAIKTSCLVLLCLTVLTACSPMRNARNIDEKIPDIAGTWYQDGNKDQPCFIVQNDRDLVFMAGKETSNGHFRNSIEVVAKDWNRNAILSNDHKTLKWVDRTWVKATFAFPDVSGTWYEDGDASRPVKITQNGTKLLIESGTEKQHAYFYTTNGIYSIGKNAYGVYSPANKAITWGSRSWLRTARN